MDAHALHEKLNWGDEQARGIVSRARIVADSTDRAIDGGKAEIELVVGWRDICEDIIKIGDELSELCQEVGGEVLASTMKAKGGAA